VKRCLVCNTPVKRAGLEPFCSSRHRLLHLQRILDEAATGYFGINPVEFEDMPPPEQPNLSRAAQA
jgi:endogenous inhibitor of DNA gyrase (YacG/DUF329 family)